MIRILFEIRSDTAPSISPWSSVSNTISNHIERGTSLPKEPMLGVQALGFFGTEIIAHRRKSPHEYFLKFLSFSKIFFLFTDP